jgi:arabinofuranosyltransferase
MGLKNIYEKHPLFFSISLALISFSILAYTVIINAWVTEDAFISLRVVDNFTNGLGLRWNVAERVQVYTHPLWIFYLSSIYFFTQEPFYTTIFASFFIVFICAIVIGLELGKKTSVYFIFCLCFATSKTLREFSTSGLEFPFTMMGITGLFFSCKKEKVNFYELGFWGCFLALNRLDTVLFSIPPILFFLLAAKSEKPLKNFFENSLKISLMFLPLLLWLIFATFYYGYPLPNTFYAKLNSGIPQIEFYKNGILYSKTLIIRDLPSFLFIAFSLVYALKNRIYFIFHASNILYYLYILHIGGDFMQGRMFAPIIFTSMLVFAFERKKEFFNFNFNFNFILFILFMLVHSHFFARQQPREFIFGQFADEKAYYDQTNSLFSPLNWREDGMALYGRDVNKNNEKFIIHGNIGMLAYIAGKNTYFVDTHALTEPFLARLPIRYIPDWRVGHLRREIPAGYEKLARDGDERDMDSNLRIYAKTIYDITRGRLFSKHRIKKIIDFNIGKYDVFLKDYKDSILQK